MYCRWTHTLKWIIWKKTSEKPPLFLLNQPLNNRESVDTKWKYQINKRSHATTGRKEGKEKTRRKEEGEVQTSAYEDCFIQFQIHIQMVQFQITQIQLFSLSFLCFLKGRTCLLQWNGRVQITVSNKLHNQPFEEQNGNCSFFCAVVQSVWKHNAHAEPRQWFTCLANGGVKVLLLFPRYVRNVFGCIFRILFLFICCCLFHSAFHSNWFCFFVIFLHNNAYLTNCSRSSNSVAVTCTIVIETKLIQYTSRAGVTRCPCPRVLEGGRLSVYAWSRHKSLG